MCILHKKETKFLPELAPVINTTLFSRLAISNISVKKIEYDLGIFLKLNSVFDNSWNYYRIILLSKYII